MTYKGAYGEQPFEKVVKAEYALDGVKDLKQAAYLQYKLMLLKPVLRAEVSFVKKSAEVEYVEPTKTPVMITAALKPVKASLKSKSELSYDEIVAKGYHG